MATQYDPIAKDESLNTTENPSRNIADVLAEELANIVTALGGGSLEDLNDVTITTPSNGQTLKYNSTTQKWENANDAGGHTIYDPDESAMTQRAGLGFTDAHVSDNSGDDRTDVSLVEAISKTDWDNLDPTDPSNNGLYEINDPNNSPILDASMVAYDSSVLSAFLNKISKSGAGSANSLCFREEISEITADMWASIADGTFSKVHTGMHYTAPSGRTYWFADADYFFGSGNPEQTAHHMLVIEDEINHTDKHQTAGTTSGGADASLIYTTTLPGIQSELETDFGASHIKSQNILITNNPSSWTWTSKSAMLMNARMAYGNPICLTYNISEMYNGGNRMRQLSIFRAMPETLVARTAGTTSRAPWWLDDVESSSAFGYMDDAGGARGGGASNTYGIRRAFLIG